VSADGFDLDELALPAMPGAPVRPETKQRGHTRFIRVPYQWWERLADAGADGPTVLLALHILYEHWRKRGAPFSLLTCAVPGVSRGQKGRALTKLEAIGLIKIERRPRKAPILQAIHVP
jgi:DNA-binding transcriptional ArsR family regulator